MRLLIVSAALLAMACSAALTSPDAQVPVEGPLRLTVSDAPATGGLTPTQPAVTVDRNTVIVKHARHGSLCRYEVTGRADVSASVVELRVTYLERLTVCTEELRLLSYRAEVFALTQQSYVVRVIHVQNNVQDTLVTQTVTLP